MMCPHDSIRLERTESANLSVDGTSCFDHNVQVLGEGTTCWLGSNYDKVVWYVVNNCEEAKPHIE
jgi:hypothetical protein